MFLSDEKAKQAKDSLKNGFMVNSGFLLKKRNLMEMLRSDKTEFPAEIIITNTAIEDSGNIEYTLYIRDIAKRIKLEKRLKTLAYHDPLTGLFNRSYFMANLKNRIEFHKENAGSVALMFLDLDGFKKINDTLGHKAGDALLCEVGVRLKQITRDEDLVGRWGGDEFVVIISGDVPENAAQRRANSIVEVMRPPVKFEGNRLRVKASVGVAISNDGDVNADELLQQADIAMYQAKQGGKDTYRLFDKTMGDNTQHAFNIENALPDALKNNHLYMLYQPKVSCEDNKIVGFEALIRWKHPTYGMISPAEFIPILEASNLIITLGKWVITQAIKQLAVMKQAGIVDQSIAVNISGKHIHDSSLLTYIKEEADKYDADVSQLEIEITESVLASDTEASIAAMKKLSDSGIKLSIDDFGTGYSSLSYLRKFPIEILKIDRAFIRNCAEDADDASICLAIISLAKSLNLKLVAEGVETEQQLMFLQQHDCDAYQGFYFSKPLGSDAVLNLIQ
jgi:Amt family ammonium transporter